MFDFIRKGVGSMIAGVLLALLIASFALWGIGDPLGTIAGGDVAEVGSEKISPNNLIRTFDRDFTQAQQTYGESFTKELAIQVGFGSQVMAQLVQRKAFDVEAHQLGLRVSDQELRDLIFSISSFQGVDGKFSRDFFNQIAYSQGYSVKELENVFRADIIRGNLIEGLRANINIPEVSIELLNKYNSEQRTAEILTIPASAMLNIGDMSDQDISQYYDQHPDRYMAPEYRDISYVEVSDNDFDDMISISDEEAIESYEARIDEFTKQEDRSFVQILLDDLDSANQAYTELENGKTFDEVILEKTGETAEDNQFEAQTQTDFAEIYGQEAADQVFSLDVNAYSKPIESAFGAYIFKVLNIDQGSSKSFETVKDDIINHLTADKKLNLLYEKTEKIEDELAAGSLINEIADAVSLQLKQVKNVSQTGLTPDGTASDQLPLIVDFLDHSFENTIDSELELYEGISNKFYMLSVDNIIESKLRPLDEVKDQVSVDVAQSRREDLASALATKITSEYDAQSTAEKSLSDYLEMGSNLVVNEVTVGRDNIENNVSSNIHRSIFNQKIGAIEMIPAADNDGFVLVRVKDRIFSNVTSDDESKKTLEAMNSSYQSDILNVYMQHLVKSLPVVVNENMVKQSLDFIVNPADQL